MPTRYVGESSILAVHGSSASTWTSTSAPIIDRTMSADDTPANCGASGRYPWTIAHHRPSRSSGPIIPAYVRPTTQYWTAGSSRTRSARPADRNSTPRLDFAAELPSSRTPNPLRTVDVTPSAPTRNRALMVCSTPAASATTASTPSPLSIARTNDQPIARQLRSLRRTASRRTCSTTGWATCCPASGWGSYLPVCSWNAFRNRMSSWPTNEVANVTQSA